MEQKRDFISVNDDLSSFTALYSTPNAQDDTLQNIAVQLPGDSKLYCSGNERRNEHNCCPIGRLEHVATMTNY